MKQEVKKIEPLVNSEHSVYFQDIKPNSIEIIREFNEKVHQRKILNSNQKLGKDILNHLFIQNYKELEECLKSLIFGLGCNCF